MGVPIAKYSILTPWLLPPGSPKKVNAGDGFIKDSAEKLIGARATHYFSNRSPLRDDDISQINNTSCLVVAGANTLRDDFTLAPEFTLSTLDRITVPVVLLGLGHYGVAGVTRGLNSDAQTLLAAILERFPYMSVRCDRSWEYVVQSASQFRDRILMTSCPVVYAVDGINKGFSRKSEYDLLVVTLTDRSMLNEQLPILDYAPLSFAAKRRVLALHQDYGNTGLHAFARQRGYEVFTSHSYQDFIALYEASDVHVGNRLHAHLKSMSLGIISFLTPFDLRQKFFAESLDFPLITSLPSPEFELYDFSRFTARREAARPSMQKLLSAIRELL
jgi:hypothetical protein